VTSSTVADWPQAGQNRLPGGRGEWQCGQVTAKDYSSSGMPVIVFLVVWLIVALLVSLAGLLHQAPIPMPMLGAAITIVLLGMLIAWPAWRQRALAGGLRPLVAIHLTRFVGFYFLWLYSLGVLPRNFAEPAGWGDVIIAALAIVLLLLGDLSTGGRRIFLLVWNLLGLLDIMMVVSLAMRMAIADRGFQNAFASLPLSLLPTYIVPLVIASHALIFYRLTRSDRVA
jgi:hypothetical protein